MVPMLDHTWSSDVVLGIVCSQREGIGQAQSAQGDLHGAPRSRWALSLCGPILLQSSMCVCVCGDSVNIQTGGAEAGDILNASVTSPATGFVSEASNGLVPGLGHPWGLERLVTSPGGGGAWALAEEAAPSWARTAGTWQKQMYTLHNKGENRSTYGGRAGCWRLSSPGAPCFVPGRGVPGRCVPSPSGDVCTAPRTLLTSLRL